MISLSFLPPMIRNVGQMVMMPYQPVHSSQVTMDTKIQHQPYNAISGWNEQTDKRSRNSILPKGMSYQKGLLERRAIICVPSMSQTQTKTFVVLEIVLCLCIIPADLQMYTLIMKNTCH